jgi:hypothetical protein
MFQPEIDWILMEECIFIRVEPNLVLAIHVAETEEIIVPKSCVMEMREGNIYFDDVLIPTESFMGFVGIYDLFADIPESDDISANIIHHPRETI